MEIARRYIDGAFNIDGQESDEREDLFLYFAAKLAELRKASAAMPEPADFAMTYTRGSAQEPNAERAQIEAKASPPRPGGDKRTPTSTRTLLLKALALYASPVTTATLIERVSDDMGITIEGNAASAEMTRFVTPTKPDKPPLATKHAAPPGVRGALYKITPAGLEEVATLP